MRETLARLGRTGARAAAAAALLVAAHGAQAARAVDISPRGEVAQVQQVRVRFDAEVVALCINLGQPEDDFTEILEKAVDLGAVESLVIDAREEFARDYVARRHG